MPLEIKASPTEEDLEIDVDWGCLLDMDIMEEVAAWVPIDRENCTINSKEISLEWSLN